MTTKTAKLSTDVVTDAPAAPAPTLSSATEIRAEYVTISEPIHVAWPAAVALIRQGWTVDLDYLPESFQITGLASITLTRKKTPTQFSALAVEIADKAEAFANAGAQQQFDKRVQDAAKKIVEDAAKAAEAAEVARQVAEAERHIEALRAKIAW